MKKLLLLFALTAFTFAFTQCTITGKSTIKVLDEETYSIATELAQCKECHLWVSIGGNADIQGDNRQNSVKLKARSGGRQVISAAVLTPQGLLQCSKNIDILDSQKADIVNNGSSDAPPIPTTTLPTTNCDIDVSNYKEVKYSENIVSFFPNVSNDSFKYQWTATYFNGENMSSTEKVPQFPYTKENGINKVTVKITSSKCLKEFSKTYDGNYWKFF